MFAATCAARAATKAIPEAGRAVVTLTEDSKTIEFFGVYDLPSFGAGKSE